jgi:hypothetical protein
MSKPENEGLLEKEPEESEKQTKWPLPFNIDIEKLDLITKAFFQASADTKSIAPADLKATTSLNATTIGANAKFLAAIGVLQTSNRRTYMLTEKGALYAKRIGGKQLTEAGAILADLLKSTSPELTQFIELQKGYRTGL